MKKLQRKKIRIWICGLGILLFLALICFTNIFRYNYRMNADIASEALLGQLIWDSGQWIPDSWYPSTEVRIIGTANLSALFYGITENMGLSMGLACVSAVLLIGVSVIFLMRETVWGGVKSYWILMVFLMLALPASYSLLEVLYLFAGYYAGHTAVFFFTLGVYGGSLCRRSIRRGLMLISIFLAFLLGMQGSRGLLVIYGPLFAVEIVRCCYHVFIARAENIDMQEQKQSMEVDWKISIWVIVNCAFNYLGSCMPASANFGFSRNIRKGFGKLWEIVVPDVIDVLGFQNVGILGQICLALLLLNAGYVLSTIFLKIWKKKEPEALEWIYLVVCASPVMAVFIVSFTTVESTGRYYFAFLIMLSMAVVLLFKQNKRYLFSVKLFAWIAIGYLSIVNVIDLYVPIMGSEEPPENDFIAVTDFLEKNGYSLAYATFENANTMTVISNGRVKVVSVASVEKMDICKWLSCTSWYPPEVSRNQTTAYLITENQMPEFQFFLMNKDGAVREVDQIGRFHIFVSDYNYVNSES